MILNKIKIERLDILKILLLIICISTVLKADVPTDNPIMFVTQFPTSAIGSTFSNHQTNPDEVGRGGDLYIRYVDGTLRNLTREAGFGIVVGCESTRASNHRA